MEPRSPSRSDRKDDLFDLAATGLLGGFTVLLLLGSLWSSNGLNELAAPFLLGAFVVVYFGNRSQDNRSRNSPTSSENPSRPYGE